MIEKIEELLIEVNSFNATSKEDIENFRIKYNGKKGVLNDFFEKFKEVPNDQKKEFGQKINTLKQAVAVKLEDLKMLPHLLLSWKKKILQDRPFRWN